MALSICVDISQELINKLHVLFLFHLVMYLEIQLIMIVYINVHICICNVQDSLRRRSEVVELIFIFAVRYTALFNIFILILF